MMEEKTKWAPYAEHDTAERTLVKANVTKREAKKLVNPVEVQDDPYEGCDMVFVDDKGNSFYFDFDGNRWEAM
jgi:hypothetical protein